MIQEYDYRGAKITLIIFHFKNQRTKIGFIWRVSLPPCAQK